MTKNKGLTALLKMRAKRYTYRAIVEAMGDACSISYLSYVESGKMECSDAVADELVKAARILK